MSSTTENPNWTEVSALLEIFYPQYFDTDSPYYVDPAILTQLNALAVETRPWCLSNAEQNLAEAWFTAYLISLRQETSSSQSGTKPAGPVLSEKEGDISVTYADLTKGGDTSTLSKRPPSDPYDGWAALWARCGRAAIITRFGDPVRQSQSMRSATTVKNAITPTAIGVWQTWPQ